MKLRIADCGLRIGTVLVLLASVAQAAPRLSVEQAAKIAADYLRERGLSDRHHISSLSIESGSVLSRSQFWLAQFTPSIKSENRNETGLRIEMDGSVVLMVTKSAKERARDVNRPSALDMR